MATHVDIQGESSPLRTLSDLNTLTSLQAPGAVLLRSKCPARLIVQPTEKAKRNLSSFPSPDGPHLDST